MCSRNIQEELLWVLTEVDGRRSMLGYASTFNNTAKHNQF